MTTILFLTQDCEGRRWKDALAWIKSQRRRLHLPDYHLWVVDAETTQDDPGFDCLMDMVRNMGWQIVGDAEWERDDTLECHEMEELAQTCVPGPVLRRLAVGE